MRHSTRRQILADLDQPLDRYRRTRDRFVCFYLTSLDALSDRNFALASQQRDDTHFAKIEPDRIV